MKRDENQEKAISITPDAAAGRVAACARQDLADWMMRGGPLPVALAEHVVRCGGCADQVRRINRVQATLTLVRGQPGPPSLIQRANFQALRMLRRAVRATKEAQRALRTRPDLTVWQKAQIHATRVSMGAAAALLVIMTRTAVDTGFEQARATGEVLGQTHWDRHIDPHDEWLHRDKLA